MTVKFTLSSVESFALNGEPPFIFRERGSVPRRCEVIVYSKFIH
jgi:hypothetical protein